MSYHVSILRTQVGQQKPITLSDFEKAVATMPGLKTSSGPRGRFEISFSEHGNKGAILTWKNGEIWAKNPERETLQVMLELAEKLNARVRGDELETYRAPEETYQHPDDLATIEASHQETKPFINMTKRKQWIVYSLIIGFFVLLGLLVSYFSR